MSPRKPLRLALDSFLVAACLLSAACRERDHAGSRPLDADAVANTQGASECNDSPSGATLDLRPGPTCTALRGKFPGVNAPEQADDLQIICPFLRTLKRTGLLETEIGKNLASAWGKDAVAPVTVAKLAAATPEIGCDGPACAAVAQSVAKNQHAEWVQPAVDIARLFDAPPRSTYKDPTKDRASHDCGYTFAFGDVTVNDQTRSATLARFKAIAEGNSGKIKVADLVQVKKESCRRDYAIYKTSGQLPFNRVDEDQKTLLPDHRDHLEVALIYAYLGGVENGYVTYEDLERFFHASVPPNKTRYLLDFTLLGMAQAAHAGMW